MIRKNIFCIICALMVICNIGFAADFNMSYIYGGSTSTNINNVLVTNNSLNEVSPSYFDLNSDGSLHLTDALDTTFISKMHEQGIKVVPFLSNHWDRQLGRTALENRENLSNELVSAIEKYNLDGINVDIENVSEIDKDNYTDLVRLLREKLSSNKSVSVAVAANPKGWTAGWHGSYDYKQLAKYADYLMIMAYDEHYQGGTPGSVASYDFVENSIKYALKYVPKDKIVVGLAFFGRYWNSEGVGGRGVSNKLINQILNDYNSQGEYDKTTRTMKAIINVSEEQAENDKYIFAAGTYEFWYENNDTIKEKIDLVNKYGLKGTGSWSLGQELPELWDNYSLWLKGSNTIDNGQTGFIDVKGDKWSSKQIEFVNKNKLMIGRRENEFAPEENLTRAEAVTVVNRLLNMVNKNMDNKNPSINLTDITNHWAYKDILRCLGSGIITGYEDNTFRADNNITREEIATIIDRINLEISKQNNNINFIDIDKKSWSYSSIANICKMGIMSGYTDNTFKSESNITREEMATVMYNVCNKLGVK